MSPCWKPFNVRHDREPVFCESSDERERERERGEARGERGDKSPLHSLLSSAPSSYRWGRPNTTPTPTPCMHTSHSTQPFKTHLASFSPSRSPFRSFSHDSDATYSRRPIFHAKSHPALDLSCQQVVTSRDLCSRHVNSPYPRARRVSNGRGLARAFSPGWSEQRRALPIRGNHFRTPLRCYGAVLGNVTKSDRQGDECNTVD